MAHTNAATGSEAPKLLRIGIVQGEKIIEERLVRTREDVTIGQSTRNTFIVPASDALPRSFTLFVRTPQGYALRLTDGLAGRISFGDEIVAVSALRASNRVENRGGFDQVPLSDKSRGALVLGDVRVLFQLVTPPPVQPRPQLPASVRGSILRDLNGLYTGVIAASFLLHLGFMIYLRNVDFPRVADIEELPPDFHEVYLRPIPKITPEKKEEVVAAKTKIHVARPTEIKSPTAEKPKPVQTAEKRAEMVKTVSNMGAMKVLSGLGESGSVVRDLLGNGEVFKDSDAVFRDLSGVGVAGANTNGIAPRGTSSGSMRAPTSLMAVGPDSVSSGARSMEREVTRRIKDTQPVDIDGPIDATKLVGEIRARIRGITACYENGLKRNQSLSGKIQLRFELNSVGKVTSAEIEEDTMKDDEIGACIKSRVMSWRLPSPGARSVQFSYPFIFQAAK